MNQHNGYAHCCTRKENIIYISGGSRKLGTGGRLRQNQVLAVCTERSTGKSPPPSLIIMALNGGGGGGGGGGAPGAPLNPRLYIDRSMKEFLLCISSRETIANSEL